MDRGAGAEDAEAAARAGFLLDEVLSIESIGLRETFDLTIEGSHSFVADGLVVHNTIPHYGELATRLRRCFPAPPGCAVLSLDFQQGELRIIACLSGDRNMVRAYREGMDLHAITASGVMGMSLDDFLAQDADTIGELRRRGKAGNFGLVFGMSPQGYQHYAWNEFQVELSLEQAETDHDAFFATYPGIKPWHQRQIGEVHRTGQVRSPLGRVRRLPLVRSPDERARRHAERQSINAPVQATLTDMMSWSLAEIHRRWPELALFGMVHDNGLAYVPEDDVELWAGRCAEVMEHLPLAETFGWETPIGFPIDAEAGPTMGDLEKLTA